VIKQSTIVGRSKLTTLAMVNVPWRKAAEKSAKLRVWGEVPEASPLFFKYLNSLITQYRVSGGCRLKD